jgi:hypothetical protein
MSADDKLIKKGPNSDGSGASNFAYDALGNLLTSQPSDPDSSTLLPTTYRPYGLCGLRSGVMDGSELNRPS